LSGASKRGFTQAVLVMGICSSSSNAFAMGTDPCRNEIEVREIVFEDVAEEETGNIF
jgi:hypothetical protein